ncbi:aldehyde dehydrogenase [Pigmentiphaga litoralis]|uniref:aldehyde dehydrogenase n=1 Tax=Pigmentiphaga litoralis TaxID=516702 RepID=UPI003899A16D
MIRPFLIGNEWRHVGRPTFESIYPADSSVSAVVAESSIEDINDAISSARQALGNPQWRDMPAHRRSRLLHRFADLVEANAEHLADTQTRDNGKTVAESRAQVAGAAEFFRYYAAVCETSQGEVVPARGSYFGFSEYEPVGVVAAITPWNSPLTLEAQKLAPALAAGNAIVLKSSEITPQIGLEYGRLALEAGFPAGVLNVVTGAGESGRTLVSHPDVDMVTFTGGTRTGRAIGQIMGARARPAILELGGKSPNIVCDDADLELAVPGAMIAIFHNAGQSCLAGSRIFVQESVYDAFVSRLVAATQALRVGDPYDATTAIAPLASFGHREQIERMLETARTDGASILTGGGRPRAASLAAGAYLEPTLLATDNRMAIAREEVFGPVGCIIPFKDDEDLLRQANDNDFGLACGIWTRDHARALRLARRINTGVVWINTYKITAVNMPFGGNKSSGVGREGGWPGMRAYMVEKSYYVNTAASPVAWPPGA